MSIQLHVHFSLTLYTYLSSRNGIIARRCNQYMALFDIKLSPLDRSLDLLKGKILLGDEVLELFVELGQFQDTLLKLMQFALTSLDRVESC